MEKYFPPEIRSYNSQYLFENIGPIQTAYVSGQIRAITFNTNTPSINRYFTMSENANIYRITKGEIKIV